MNPYNEFINKHKQKLDNFYLGLLSCIVGPVWDLKKLKKLYDTTPYEIFEATEENVLEHIATNPFLYMKYKKLTNLTQGLCLSLYEEDSYVQKRNTFAFSVLPFNITHFENIFQCVTKNNNIRILDRSKLAQFCRDENNVVKTITESEYNEAFQFIIQRFCVDVVGEDEFQPCPAKNYTRIAEQYITIRKLCIQYHNSEQNKTLNNEIVYEAVYLKNPVKVFLMKGFFLYLYKIKGIVISTTPVDNMVDDVLKYHPFMRTQLQEFLKTNDLD